MRKLLIILMVSLLVVGCGQSSNQNNETDDTENDTSQMISYDVQGATYRVIIPFEQSARRNYHGSTGRNDTIEIGSRLQEMAGQYFSFEDYYVSEGNVISSTLHDRLIKYSSIYDEGLNPEADSEFQTTSNQTVVGPVIVHDVVEIDFYDSLDSDREIKGVAIAITLNKFTTLDTGAVLELSEETLLEWGESSARKLVSIIRSQPGMTNLPIFIGLYSLEKKDATIPGGFISSAFFEGRSGQFDRVKEEWLLFPSSRATSRFNQLAVEFDLFKEALNSVIQSETTGVIAQGRVIGSEIDHLRMTINTSGKTFLELQALTEYAASLLNRFDSFGVSISIQVKVFNEVVAVVSLDAVGDQPTIIYF